MACAVLLGSGIFAGHAVSAPCISYVHSDQLGTPRALTNASEVVVWTADLQPFGSAIVDDDPDTDGTTITMPIRFPGQRFDGETGLHYNYFRDYDPSLGRYIQSDPIGLAGGLNTYAYVGGNPLMYTVIPPLLAVCLSRGLSSL